MEKTKEDDVEELKSKLRNYAKEDIEFNEPHFSQQLVLIDGNKKEVLNTPYARIFEITEKGEEESKTL